MPILEILNLIFFQAAAVLCAVACYRGIKRDETAITIPEQPENNEKLYNISLAVIAAISVFVRVWQFGSVPGGFNQDGAMAAVDGFAIGQYGTDRFGTFMPAHFYAWGNGQMSAMLPYMIAPLTRLFGLNPVTARLPLLFTSLCGGVFLYILVKDIFGKRTAWIAAAVVALNPWHLVQSRWAVDCNLLPHFFIAGLCFLNKGLQGNRKHIFISMIFFGLCMYCYGVALYTIPVFLLITAVYYCVVKRLKPTDVLISAGIYLLVAWPFLITMAINFFKWETIRLPFMTIQYYPESTRSGDILFFSEQPVSQLISNAEKLISATLLQAKDLPWNDVKQFGTMYLFSMPFVILGIIQVVSSKKNAQYPLVIIALVTAIISGLITNGVNVNRINIIYYVLMILLAVGISAVLGEIKKSRAILAAMYGLMGCLLIITYFTSYKDMIADCFFDGFGQALECAQESGAEKIYITDNTQMVRSDAVSEILTLFHDATDIKYFQGETNINHGIERLPYTERYNYVTIDETTQQDTAGESAAYVMLVSELQYFDTEEYDVETFRLYCALTRKQGP